MSQMTGSTIEHFQGDVESERRLLRTVLDVLPVGVWIADSGGRMLEYNRAAEEIWGGVPPETNGPDDYARYKGWWPGAGKPVEPREWALARAVLNGETVCAEEVDIEAFDGTRKTILNYAVPIRDDGHIIGGVAANVEITTLRRYQKAVEESERVFHTVFEGMLCGVAIIDDEMRFIEANTLMGKITGVPPDQLKSRSAADFAEPGVDVRRLWEAFIREGRFRGESRVLRSDGTFRDVEVLGTRNILPGRHLLVVHDITERKLTEEALKASELKFRAIFEGTQDAIVLLGDDMRYMEANPAVQAVFGLPPRELLGRSAAEFAERSFDLDANWKIFLDVGSYRGDNKIVRADGSLRMVETMGVANFIPGRHLFVFHDITDRKEAEDALRRSEERFRTLADSLPQAVITALPDGTVDYVNRRWEEYTGLKPQDAYGWGWTAIIHPEDRQAMVDDWSESLATGRTSKAERRVRRRDGSYRWHLFLAVPDFDPVGRVIKWYASATDIDDQKRAEEDANRYAQGLARSNKDLEQFAYVASHDLQEPLRMVTSYLQLLQQRLSGRLGDEADEFIAFAFDGATRMQRLIGDMLTYSRVSTQALQFAPVEVDKAVSDALADLAATVADTGATMTRDLTPTVWGDETQVSQVFLNLIGNALKFRSERVPRVHIGARRGDDAWIFSVSDNGIGIDPCFGERIFQIFQRLHSRREYPGTGIGLAICKRIVERHGGRIWFESTVGEGTTFFFTIPDRGAAADG